MRGLRTKLSDLRCTLSCLAEDYDVIVLVETWLNSSIRDAELGFNDFNVFRMDRNSDNSDCLRGGGVLIAVRNCFLSRILKTTVTDVEQLFVDIRRDRERLIIGAAYLPPASDLSVYERHCHAMEEVLCLSPNADIIIAGDYNLPRTFWHNRDGCLSYDAGGYCHMSEQALTLLHCFNEFNFFQYNNVVNNDLNTLDLVFSTMRDVKVLPAYESVCACDDYHPALVISLPMLGTAPLPPVTNWSFDFKRANYAAINHYLVFCGMTI